MGKKKNKFTEEQPHDIHDRGYKFLLSFWKMFQQLMEGYVPGEWRNRLDYAHSERLNKTFILKRFRKREADILYKVPLFGEEEKAVYLYVLIEHQSTVDYTLAFRILIYLVEIWKEFYKNSDRKWRKQKAFRLPPVFPIVLYNGADSWTAFPSVRELVEQGELLGDFTPNVKYHLIDIPRLGKEKVKQIGNSLAAVFLLEHELSTQEFQAALREALSFVLKETDDELAKAVLEWMAVRLQQVLKEEELEKVIEDMELTKHRKEEVTTMLETTMSKLISSCRQEGRQEGHQQGRQAGIRESIIRVLNARFGQPLEEIKDKLNFVASVEDWEVLLEKAATAQSMKEFKKVLTEMTKKQ